MKGVDDDGKMSSGNDDKVFVNVPEPNKIVKYFIPSSSSSKKKKKDDDADDDDGLLRGAVYLYGNSSSDQIALCCAGFPDDHTIFQPFAELLAKRGNVFVGVMCLPGTLLCTFIATVPYSCSCVKVLWYLYLCLYLYLYLHRTTRV